MQQRSDFIQSIKMVLYGDFSISSEIKPSELKPTCSCDSTNDQLIHFHHKQADLGPIYKVKLILAIEKTKIKLFKNLKWFLNMIEIDYHKEKFLFDHKKWINLKKYDLKKNPEFKLYEKNFSKEQKRTICTLSHRLLEESIQNDSYDESFDETDERKKKSSRSNSPAMQRNLNRDSSSFTPRSNRKSDLKSRLRFEQDLEELASSDSTLSIVSSNSFKSSPKKSSRNSRKNHHESKWSDDEDYKSKRSPSPNSWKLSSKKEKKRSEWSSDDDDIRSKKSPTTRTWKSPSKKVEKTHEWSSEDASFNSISPRDRKFTKNEKFKWNDHPTRGKLSENLSPIPSYRQQAFKRDMDKENLSFRKKEFKPTILDEDYDKYSDSPIPKLSSSLMNRFKQKDQREKNFNVSRF